MKNCVKDTHRQSGFTLLELLVVVAILAIVGGGVIVAYDGLEQKAALGTATNSMANLDKSMRTFKVLSGGDFPTSFDSLVEASTTGTDTNSATLTATTTTNLISMTSALRGKLGPFALTQDMLDALNEVGISDLRYVGSSLQDGGGVVGNTAPGDIPNRVFDSTPRGRGISRTLVAGDRVAVVESINIADFDGLTPSTSDRLRDIGRLDDQIGHVVAAFGIGNNCTLVKNTDNFSTGLAEAPFYSNVGSAEYSRYIALFHLASDDGAGGATPNDGTYAPSEVFSKAKLLAVLDSKGDWYDEEFAEYTGQKQ